MRYAKGRQMVVRKKSESRQKTKLVQVRATPEEKEILRDRAAAFGISVGELCRQAIFGSKPKAKTDQAAISELAAARADLGRLGGLLKGWLAGSFPNTSAPSIQEVIEVRTLLKQIEAAQAVAVASIIKVSDVQ
jgi:predicted aconitase